MKFKLWKNAFTRFSSSYSQYESNYPSQVTFFFVVEVLDQNKNQIQLCTFLAGTRSTG
jgi:hypothetical protein